MVAKREIRDAIAALKGRRQVQEPVELSGLAEGMFVAYGKNPYIKGEMAIHNLDELVRNIDSFEHHEAPWVADWIEYLGDAEAARMIRSEPAHFKRIIHQRWTELKNEFK